MNRINPSRFLIVTFLAMLAVVPLLQAVVEIRHGERPQVLEFVTRPPSSANLRATEHSLEEDSVAARALRPWLQAGQFFGLREAGEKAIVGRDGWIFYQPGLAYLTQRSKPEDSTSAEALAAILDFRDQLAARGIQLVLLPVPNKESVYPDKLSRRASPPTRVIASDTRAFLTNCEQAGLEVVDLFAFYRNAREQSAAELYLAQDSHWSPAGMKLAAEAVAGRILNHGELTRGQIAYDVQPADVQRLGDLVRMLHSPPIESRVVSESIGAGKIVRHDDGTPYADDPASPVLVMGDSFLRIYEQDEPEHAGFIAHLARELGRPLASIVNDGGASTLVRQELFHRPKLLAGKKVVVWEFVERDLRLGTEGWQQVPLPPESKAGTP
jgi:hypothetical protein